MTSRFSSWRSVGTTTTPHASFRTITTRGAGGPSSRAAAAGISSSLPLRQSILYVFLGIFLANAWSWWRSGGVFSGAAQVVYISSHDSSQQQPEQQPTVSLALKPRAMSGNGCSLPLECAWSLDSIRTQVVSARIEQLATQGKIEADTINTDAKKNKNTAWDDERYTKLNRLYEDADASFLSSTGIVKLNLPPSVHVIPVGGEPYFRRSLRDADLVMDGFLRSGSRSTSSTSSSQPQPAEEWLDFGGSHGRVTQILAAAYPDTVWHVCDPIAETVQWASQQLPQKKIRFQVMGQKPPLAHYQDNQFAGIYAISIWSHYSEQAALVWFAEMHRILKPGGRLWFSTHGYQALNFAALPAAALAVHGQREAMLTDLYLKGHFYYSMFGTAGDWGVSDGTSDGSWWGYGAFLPEWLAAHVLNHPDWSWRLDYFGPGVNEKHQDVYVLYKHKQ